MGLKMGAGDELEEEAAVCGVVEYAEGRRGQSECLMKGLSFYCLVDMMLVS